MPAKMNPQALNQAAAQVMLGGSGEWVVLVLVLVSVWLASNEK